jgi:hypothetical protein
MRTRLGHGHPYLSFYLNFEMNDRLDNKDDNLRLCLLRLSLLRLIKCDCVQRVYIVYISCIYKVLGTG